MKREEANNLAAHLKGLLPTMTDEQMKAARDELEKLPDVKAASSGILAYASSNERFTLPSFVRAIKPVGPSISPLQRTQAYLDDLRRRAVDTERVWADVDRVVAGLDEQTFAAEAEIALQNLPDLIATAERRRGVCRETASRLLKGMIAERLAMPKEEEADEL